MPESDVRILAYAKQKVYTVRFSANGKILATFEHLYGELPSPPTPPTLSADDEYSYTFSGWSSEILPVTEDRTYEAQYLATPIEKSDEGGIKLSPKILKLFIAAVAVAVALMTLAVTLITVKIVRKKRKLIADGEATSKATEKTYRGKTGRVDADENADGLVEKDN